MRSYKNFGGDDNTEEKEQNLKMNEDYYIDANKESTLELENTNNYSESPVK